MARWGRSTSCKKFSTWDCYVAYFIYSLWTLGHDLVGKSQNLFNMSLFPYSVPVGLYLLWAAISQRCPRPAMAASPFLAPYHTLFSLAGPLIALLDHPKLLAFSSFCLWMLVVVHAMILG